MKKNKQRTIILPLAMMFSLTGCDPKSYKPTTINLEEEMKKCEQTTNCDSPSQVVINPDGSTRTYHSSGMGHFLMYYYLFGGRTSSNFSNTYMNNHSSKIKDFSSSQMGKFSGGGYATHSSSLSGARSHISPGSPKSSSSKSFISRGGFGSKGKSFSVRA